MQNYSGYKIEAVPKCHCGGVNHPGCRVVKDMETSLVVIEKETKEKCSKQKEN